ncbi:hypothetical protein F383_05810 [Gossypium arboreum]|uniref:Uncharacterized protein n=1 Tax=Gossypium arboreum TaxID=29729 RepID=A0A0B0NRP3_GOSAR|nr:hypothetical protein F383_05810 [Gossypium arboreum]
MQGGSSGIILAIGFVAVFVLRQRYDQRCPRRSAAHGTSYFPKHAMWLLGGAAVSWLIGPAWKYDFDSAKEN